MGHENHAVNASVHVAGQWCWAMRVTPFLVDQSGIAFNQKFARLDLYSTCPVHGWDVKVPSFCNDIESRRIVNRVQSVFLR
jgi:hypothetical protein